MGMNGGMLLEMDFGLGEGSDRAGHEMTFRFSNESI